MKVARVLLTVLGGVLVVVNILLVRQNAKLRYNLERITRQYYRQVELPLDSFVPPLDGVDSNGTRSVVSYGVDPRKTLLLVFSPTCEVCDENWPSWNRIVASIEELSVRVVGVNISETLPDEYVGGFGLSGMQVLTQLDDEDKRAYRLSLTPQTILVNAYGRVEGVWSGRLGSDREQEIKAKLSQRS